MEHLLWARPTDGARQRWVTHNPYPQGNTDFLRNRHKTNYLERFLREESANCWDSRRGGYSPWPPLWGQALRRVSFSPLCDEYVFLTQQTGESRWGAGKSGVYWGYREGEGSVVNNPRASGQAVQAGLCSRRGPEAVFKLGEERDRVWGLERPLAQHKACASHLILGVTLSRRRLLQGHSHQWASPLFYWATSSWDTATSWAHACCGTRNCWWGRLVSGSPCC